MVLNCESVYEMVFSRMLYKIINIVIFFLDDIFFNDTGHPKENHMHPGLFCERAVIKVCGVMNQSNARTSSYFMVLGKV